MPIRPICSRRSFRAVRRSVSASYDERIRLLRDRGIALWDVVARGHRRASADATIRAEVPNAIPELLDAHPNIRAVAFNGGGARRLHDRHFICRPGLTYLALPSTSPAYASIGFAAKLAQWQALREVLLGRD